MMLYLPVSDLRGIPVCLDPLGLPDKSGNRRDPQRPRSREETRYYFSLYLDKTHLESDIHLKRVI